MREIIRFEWNTENRFSTSDVDLEIPEGSLYHSLNFHYEKFPIESGYFSNLHQLEDNTVPFHSGAILKIIPVNLSENLEDKALLVSIDSVTGQYWSAGGKYEDGWVSSKINVLGLYAIRVDTVPPTIKPLSISNKNTLTEKERIRFIVKDDLSGINKYEGYLDGKWALFEYDPRINQIVHYFDSKRFKMNRQHQLKLIVSDNKNNIAVYEATFRK